MFRIFHCQKLYNDLLSGFNFLDRIFVDWDYKNFSIMDSHGYGMSKLGKELNWKLTVPFKITATKARLKQTGL